MPSWSLTVYKLHIGFVLQIEHNISRLYAKLARFSTYGFLSNSFFQESAFLFIFVVPYKLHILHYTYHIRDAIKIASSM